VGLKYFQKKKNIVMTDKEKIEKLKHAFEETIWMAIRYADGRQTYAPSMVRDAIKEFQMVFPDWKPKKDITIKPPNKE
jgi:hypothetical protein